MNLEEKITSPNDLLKVEQIENSAFFKECENLYGPLSDDTFWKYRERLRSMYVYKPINIKGLPFHFLHLNHEDPNLIAFTANDKIGKKDGKTFIKPGKYLAQHTNLNNEQIKNVVTEYKYKFVPPKLYYADTPEKVIDIYENGPGSCMCKKGWSERNHPTRIYFGPDTNLIYIKNKAGDGYTARAVIRTDVEPPQYIRVYGDKAFFQKALTAAKIEQAPKGLSGVRLPVIWQEDRENKTLLMPYVDGGAQTGFIKKKRDERDFVHMGKVPEGENENDYFHFSCTNTSGTVNMPDVRNCGECGKETFEDDITEIEGDRYCSTCLESIDTVVVNEGQDDERIIPITMAREYRRYQHYEDKWYTTRGLQEAGMFYWEEDSQIMPMEETGVERNTGNRQPLYTLMKYHGGRELEYTTRFNHSSFTSVLINMRTYELYAKGVEGSEELETIDASLRSYLRRAKEEHSGNRIQDVVNELTAHPATREFLKIYLEHYNGGSSRL